MIEALSILLPTYNTPCIELVKTLHKQALCIPKLSFEIIVLDDGSTDKNTIEANKRIDNLSHCRYLMRGYNRGRAATRNELASTARFDWLLFIDSDMAIRDPNYLRSYIEMDEADVTYGGYVINGDKKLFKGNLRYKYERQYEGNRDASKRKEHPYEDFHTSNFLVRRTIMNAHLLDERFVRYGYEDVAWGKSLRKTGIKIHHVDNPVSFEVFESNEDFLQKTIEGVATLAQFGEELKEYSKIINIVDRLKRLHLAKLFAQTFKIVEKPLKNNLLGNKPSIFLFNIYKIGLYLMLSEK